MISAHEHNHEHDSEQTDARWVGIALVVAIIAISLAAIFFRKAAPTHPLVAAGIRLAIAAGVLAPFMIRRVIALPRAVKLAGIVGGMLYAVHFGAWVWSLTMTSVAASVTLVTATPIMLALYGLLSNRDRPGSRLGIALVLAIIGVGCIGGYDLGLSTRALVGDLLALVGALGMAIYMVVVRRLGAIDTMAFINIAAAVGALILLSTAMAIGISPLPPTSEAWLWLALAALVPQLIGHTILTWSLRHTTPTRVAMMTVGEPVGAATLAWVWLGDQLSMQVILGCAITCAAVLTAISDGRVGSESLKENSTSEK